jgi:SnoaL-like domain
MGLSAHDRLDIEQLYARYAHAADGGDGEAWADCFTPDGVFLSFGVRRQGRDELVQVIAGTERRPAGRHWVNNLVVEPADFGATGRAYLTWLQITKSPVAMPTTGIYHDELIRAPEGWRFRSRDFVSDS